MTTYKVRVSGRIGAAKFTTTYTISAESSVQAGMEARSLYHEDCRKAGRAGVVLAIRSEGATS